MNHECHNLDGYLAGNLPAGDAAAFVEHLLNCDDCREAVDEQQWIDGLLQSRQLQELEPTPRHLTEAMQLVMARQERRQKRLMAVAWATAAALLVALGSIPLSRHAGDWLGKGVDARSITTNDKQPAYDRPRATFVASSNAIAVPIASRHPDVTIVRVYPAFRPRIESQTAAIEPEATNANSWQSYSNGG
jgi:anti-sigma factor RsiW